MLFIKDLNPRLADLEVERTKFSIIEQRLGILEIENPTTCHLCRIQMMLMKYSPT